MATRGERSRAADSVDSLIDQLAQLTEEDVLLLGQLWDDEDQGTRQRAWQRAKVAIERAGLGEVLNQARDEVGHWMMAGPADYQGIGGTMLGQEGSHVFLRRHAAPAVLDAIVALLAQSDLHSADYDVLSRPWRSTVDQAPQV